MAKKNKNKTKKQRGAETKTTTTPQKVTLEAIAAMSDSDGEDIPEDQWNSKTKDLAAAIQSGKFDELLEQMKGGDDTDDDDDGDEMEEATLDSSSAEEDDDEEEEKEVKESKPSKSSKKASEADSDDDESYEEEDCEDEPMENAKEEADSDQDGDQSEEDSDEEEETSDDEEEKEGNARTKQLRANNAKNSKALSVVTAELVAAHAKLPWAERFDVIPKTPLPFGENGDPESNPLDVHDDLKREVAFYKLALEGVHEARKLCKKAKVPFSRPDDFFAEMVKTDGKGRYYGAWKRLLFKSVHFP